MVLFENGMIQGWCSGRTVDALSCLYFERNGSRRSGRILDALTY